jgi:hypothetical protein
MAIPQRPDTDFPFLTKTTPHVVSILCNRVGHRLPRVFPLTPSIPKYKHFLTSVVHVWPFVLFKRIWIYCLFCYDMFYHHIYFEYIIIAFTFLQFFEKTTGQMWSAKVNKELYFGTERVLFMSGYQTHSNRNSVVYKQGNRTLQCARKEVTAATMGSCGRMDTIYILAGTSWIIYKP